MPDVPVDVPSIRVRAETAEARGTEQVYSERFVIGREEGCEVCVPHPRVSRRHAEVVHRGGAWWIEDLGSANGLFLRGERIERLQLMGATEVRLGKDGPVLHLHPEGQAAVVPAPAEDRTIVHPASAARTVRVPGRSVDDYAAHYFGDAATPAGDHTRMIRQAYKVVQEKQRRQYVGIAAGVAIVIVLLLGFVAWQQIRIGRMEDRLNQMYTGVRALETQILQFRHLLVERSDASIEEQLARLEAQQAEQIALLEGAVQEFGYRRRMTPKEQVIHRVARVFNESEFEIPGAFIGRIREEMETYWLTPSGRGRFIRGIERAEAEGYTRLIAGTMQRYGLPPEFFYLALVESDFNPRVVGPETRYGHAKGMWQFIPETGAAYGLEIGPERETGAYDPDDERHDPAAATDAAARYLLEIHSQLAGASGLLAMASYNWGERRVVSGLKKLFEGIPDEVADRTYWRFYTEYNARMPAETKDYVARIFAAAVIGEDPRLFGFEIDNPLAPYLTEAGSTPAP